MYVTVAITTFDSNCLLVIKKSVLLLLELGNVQLTFDAPIKTAADNTF